MRVSDGAPSRVNSASVEASYGTVLVASVTNLAWLPSARTTVISSPLCSLPRYQNTAGPLVQSRWPAITASPTSPGAEPSLYQATRSVPRPPYATMRSGVRRREGLAGGGRGGEVSGPGNGALTRWRVAWRQATRRRSWAVVLWLSLVAALALPGLLLLLNAMAV